MQEERGEEAGGREMRSNIRVLRRMGKQGWEEEEEEEAGGRGI